MTTSFYQLREQADACWKLAQEIVSHAEDRYERGQITTARWYEILSEATAIQRQAGQLESRATDAYLEEQRRRYVIDRYYEEQYARAVMQEEGLP